MALIGRIDGTGHQVSEDSLSGLRWHAGEFVIFNVLFWTLDLTLGQEGAQWAYWITGLWALALAFHVLAHVVDGRTH